MIPQPEENPQPMELDDQDPSDPITILQTLVSNPNPFLQQQYHLQTLASRDDFPLPFLHGHAENRTVDLENSASVEADVAVDMTSIFRVWDLNTESPELENGTLTDVLTALVAKRENCWFDDGQGFVSLRPTVDAFDLGEMKSALEAQMMERLPAAVDGGREISVSALVRLFRSIL